MLPVAAEGVTAAEKVTGLPYKEGFTEEIRESDVAPLFTSTLSIHSHSIQASYSGDANFGASTSASVNQAVKENPTYSMACTPAESNSGQSVNCSLTLPSDATGTVQFQDGNNNIGGLVTVSGGAASFSTSTFSLGTHDITATYSGDNTYFSITTSTAETVESFQVGGVSPGAGQAGSVVTIQGQGFEAGGTVTFAGGITGQVKLWSDAFIYAVVPANALSGPITVSNGFSSGTSSSFTVTPPTPYLNSISENTGLIGDNLYLAGSNFGATPGSVKFSGLRATANSWSDQLIQVTVPAGAASGSVIVTASNGQSSNAIAFTVALAPTITSLAPSSGDAGTTVSITATNVGSQQPLVIFNGISVPPQGVSTNGNITTIMAVAPLGVTTGPVTVRASGLTSNSQTFTVVPTGATSVGIVPSNTTMTVGDQRQLQLRDDREHSITTATWSLSSGTLAQLSADNPPILTALAPGTVTVTASYDGLVATSQITISAAGVVYSPGQTIWSMPTNASGFTIGYAGPSQDGGILQASPGDGSTPDLFAIEVDPSNNWWVRGLSSDGDQFWHTPISVGPTAPDLSKIIGDNNGGLLVEQSYEPVIKHINGVTGLPDWEYDSPTYAGTPIVDENGNIFFVENGSGGQAAPQLVELEPTHGAIIGIWQLPVGGIYNPGNPFSYAATVGPLSAFNGNIYFVDDVYSEYYAPLPGGGMAAEYEEGAVKIMQFSPASGVTELAEFYNQSDTCTNFISGFATCTLLNGIIDGLYYEPVSPLAPVPDGNGGVLVAWDGDDTGGTGAHLFVVDTNAPNNLAMEPRPTGSVPSGPLVLGDSGNFFTTDESNVYSISISSLTINWEARGAQIIAATSGGGVLVSAPTENTYFYIDQNGNEYPYGSNALVSPDLLNSGSWLAQSSGGLLSDVLGEGIGIANSIWPFPGGNPSGNGGQILSLTEGVALWASNVNGGRSAKTCKSATVDLAPLSGTLVWSTYQAAQAGVIPYIDPLNSNSTNCANYFTNIGQHDVFLKLKNAVSNQTAYDGNNSLITEYNAGAWGTSWPQSEVDPLKNRPMCSKMVTNYWDGRGYQTVFAESQIQPKLGQDEIPNDPVLDVYYNTAVKQGLFWSR